VALKTSEVVFRASPAAFRRPWAIPILLDPPLK
jgi:hypothetical protein